MTAKRILLGNVIKPSNRAACVCRLAVSGANTAVVESGVSIAEISVKGVVSRRNSVVRA
jgi:hypothetical protein